MYPSSQYAAGTIGRALSRAAARGVAVRPWSDALDEVVDPHVHQPVLYLVAEGAPPPQGLGSLEDWVREPWDPDELAARVDRLETRARALGPVHLSFDPDGLLKLDDQIVILSPTETALMAVLVPRLGEVVSRGDLVAAVWPGQEENLRLLNRHLVNLRKRLDGLPLALHSVRGRGILLDKVAP
jgi:DNA-binding response OmpR family regulator